MSDEESNQEDEGMLYAVRTVAGKEEQVMDFIQELIKKDDFLVYSLLHPHGMRGYFYVEAKNIDEINRAIRGAPYTKGVVENPFPYTEIKEDLKKEKVDYNILKNDVVKIISGTFKQEKAKVLRVEKDKKQVVVEFLDSPTPIPVTLSIDSVKVIRRNVDTSDINEDN